jgi:hypothetical protein
MDYVAWYKTSWTVSRQVAKCSSSSTGSRDRIKLLHWQHGGFVLYYKRLEKGTISLPSLDSKSTSCQVSYTDLVLMIEGISVERVVQKERYTNHLKTVKNR